MARPLRIECADTFDHVLSRGNARHDRSGHLFQRRFKGFVVEDEDYLRRLLFYVHRNPLRAGLVERLADYRWSSYGCLAYRRRCPKWLALLRVRASGAIIALGENEASSAPF